MGISDLEETLRAKAETFLAQRPGSRAEHTEDVFARRFYLSPERVEVVNHLRRKPLAVFNPGAVYRDGVVHLFVRLIFDYYGYASSVGYVALPLEDLLAGQLPDPLSVEIVLYPTEVWEASRGCEDPRAHAWGAGFLLFYTGVGKLGEARLTDHKDVFFPALALAEFDPDLKLRRKGLVRIGPAGKSLLLPAKGATLLQGNAVLLRPSLPGVPDMGWRGRLDWNHLSIDQLEPILAPESFEFKVGWSTNAYPLGDGTYLVAYHGILRRDLSYRHGFALLSGDGELLALSSYLLAPQGLVETYGDRPFTLYGNGLFLHGDELVFVGGVGDYAVGVFTAPWQEVLVRLTPL
ncbi:hypothetical protein CSW23_10000 [Thermus scotoductus]|uniref:Glycosidase n=1 Tax=Thermus scotoductus TaxID=37636 RepID=A0A430UYU0_THESC|nr:hypothetical protein [Thermus scotoductus]RTH98288.1 hypothetical protein CSW31_10210 [Thermus scotoductus]RTI14691.1 hypothetical protein CSW23_10000 [Thermus scotoductus]